MDELSSITDDTFLGSRSHSNSTSSHDYEMIASDGLAAAYGVLAVVALVRHTFFFLFQGLVFMLCIRIVLSLSIVGKGKKKNRCHSLSL